MGKIQKAKKKPENVMEKLIIEIIRRK